VAVILSILVAVIAAPGAVTDLVLEIDPGVGTGLAQAVETDLEAVTGLVQVAEIDPEAVRNQAQVVAVTDPVPEQGQVRDRNQAQVAVTNPAPEQDQVQGRNPVQAQDLAQAQDRVRVTRVPLVARARVEVLHPGTVNVVHRVAPANLAQEVHPAEVVVDEAVPVEVAVDAAAAAEVAVADVGVDLK
jgi:hypothetical protein